MDKESNFYLWLIWRNHKPLLLCHRTAEAQVTHCWHKLCFVWPVNWYRTAAKRLLTVHTQTYSFHITLEISNRYFHQRRFYSLCCDFTPSNAVVSNALATSRAIAVYSLHASSPRGTEGTLPSSFMPTSVWSWPSLASCRNAWLSAAGLQTCFCPVSTGRQLCHKC